MDKRRKQEIIRSNEIQLDNETNAECLRIKVSRELCGCSCLQGLCLPETCQCAQDEIGCLVDKPSFPCACTKSSCKNPYERHEFDSDKVRSHYEDTLKRLKSESRRQPGATPPLSSPLSELTTRSFTRSFEKLELKTPPPINRRPIMKSASVSAITTQFSTSSPISLPSRKPPFQTPPNVTRRRQRKRYPVTPTFRQEQDADDEPSIIIIDSPGRMEIDDSIQILPVDRPTTRSAKQLKTEVCEVVITSPPPRHNNSDLFSIHQGQCSSEELVVDDVQKSLLSVSRSLSAATTTTDETSRTNSTEDFQSTSALTRGGD